MLRHDISDTIYSPSILRSCLLFAGHAVVVDVVVVVVAAVVADVVVVVVVVAVVSVVDVVVVVDVGR